MTDPIRIDRLATLIKEAGYRASVQNGIISTAVGGTKCLVFCNEGWDSIQMYAGFTQNSDNEFTLDKVNSFNSGYRFVKCYLSENRVAFEGDFFIDIDAQDASRVIERIFSQWEVCTDLGRKALREEKSS